MLNGIEVLPILAMMAKIFRTGFLDQLQVDPQRHGLICEKEFDLPHEACLINLIMLSGSHMTGIGRHKIGRLGVTPYKFPRIYLASPGAENSTFAVN